MRKTQGQPNPLAEKRKKTAEGWQGLPWRGMTPEQAEAWIEENTKTLADSRRMLRLLARAVVLLAQAAGLE